ncbi:MAG: ABC transporter permease, partial [Nitrospirae bacterium]|nr:ABC transporter permease [Nitrospirota bacterium]
MAQKSNFKIIINRLRRNKMAWFAMWIIIALAFFALFADFISPYDYDEQSRTKSYHP